MVKSAVRLPKILVLTCSAAPSVDSTVSCRNSKPSDFATRTCSLADAVRGGIAVMAAVVYCRAAATMRETMETEVGVEVGTGVFYAGLAAFTTYVGAGMVGRKVEATGKVKDR